LKSKIQRSAPMSCRSSKSMPTGNIMLPTPRAVPLNNDAIG